MRTEQTTVKTSQEIYIKTIGLELDEQRRPRFMKIEAI